MLLSMMRDLNVPALSCLSNQTATTYSWSVPPGASRLERTWAIAAPCVNSTRPTHVAKHRILVMILLPLFGCDNPGITSVAGRGPRMLQTLAPGMQAKNPQILCLDRFVKLAAV